MGWLFGPILGPLWQIGFSKMAINCIFLDLGPLKRYQWGPNTCANVIWGHLGGFLVKNRGLEGYNGFRTWILAKNGHFQNALESIFFNPITFPCNPRLFMT